MWKDKNREFVWIFKEMFYHYLAEISFLHLIVEIPWGGGGGGKLGYDSRKLF
jgi:hypothetical protein